MLSFIFVALCALTSLSFAFELPSFPSAVSLSFGSRPIALGEFITPQQTVGRPVVHWPEADAHSLYTLVLLDPDAPSASNPSASPWLHWLVVNVRGSTLRHRRDLPLTSSSDSVRVVYASATPPQQTGTHRYILYVYHQTEKLKLFETEHEPVTKLINQRDTVDRARWQLDRFVQLAATAGVDLVLQAGTYFISSSDPITRSTDEPVEELKASHDEN